MEWTGEKGQGKEHSKCSSSRVSDDASQEQTLSSLLSRLEHNDGAVAASEARGTTPHLEEWIHMASERQHKLNTAIVFHTSQIHLLLFFLSKN